MNRIHRLSQDISKRLAAGEVIQNPASVVKELVENAIDAGSTAVTVEIKNGGRDMIRVTDNGSGIHPDDILSAFEKHATSKINDFNDIYSIDTLGFRGEALASIAAVSNTELRSQAEGMDEGRILRNFGPQDGCPQPAGLPFGTTVIVRDLFYNIPARRKFMKKAYLEALAVTDLMEKLILSRPDISFRYINGESLCHSPGNGDISSALSAVFGHDCLSHLSEVSYEGRLCSVHGFVSDTSLVYRTTKNQILFVNGRYVKSSKITQAVNAGYNERLMKGRFPMTVLYITVPSGSVDVNVHPSKTYVNINGESEILPEITDAVRDSLNVYAVPRAVIPETKEKTALTAHMCSEMTYAEEDTPSEVKPDPVTCSDEKEPERITFEDIVSVMPEEKKQEMPEFRFDAEYRIAGTLFDTYLIVQTGERFYIIDQHAAHERINYENLKKQDTVPSVRLLVPQIINTGSEDFALLMDHAADLKEIGFAFESFGGNSIKVSEVPSVIAGCSLQAFAEDVIGELKKGRSDIVLKKDRIIRNACRMSVKAGDRLSDEEIRLLVEELVSSGVIPACPHGRPVAVLMTRDDLEKSFKRKL